MILQYFKKKENKEQIIATNQYKKILSESNIFLNENDFFKQKNYFHLKKYYFQLGLFYIVQLQLFALYFLFF